MPSSAYFHGMGNWSDEDHFACHNNTVAKFCMNTEELQIMCIITVRSTVAERSFSFTRQINNWLRNSMLAYLLGDLPITAVYGSTILILTIQSL